MSFNNRNLNPNIWDAPRHNNPPAFINNQPNFFGNNNNNFPLRPNFHQQNNQIRPLLSQFNHHDNHPNFRNFNNNNDFPRNNNNRGRQNFHNNQQKWQNRDSRINESSNNNSNNGERSTSREPSAENQSSDDPRPKSLVEHLKSTMKKNPRSKSQENTNESIDACAKNASKKLLSQLKTMDKDNVKELINNPKQPHRKAVLNIQAREKLREGMRKQLKTLGAEDDQEASFDAAETVNYENIPETLIAQIGRTVDMDLSVEDMDLQPDMEDEIVEDKDIEVVKKNLGNDFLYGSEMLLMNGFNLLGESENEADLKIPEDRFYPPPLPMDPCRPPEPVPPPEIPPLLPNKRNADEWEIDAARNPDPPHVSQSNNNNIINAAPIQSIQVIVSHPTPQIVPPSTSNSNTSINKNPLLISLGETSEQNIIPIQKINKSEDIPKVTKTISQDSFKTPSIPEQHVSSTPKSFDAGKTPFINDDGGKTPFINDDSGKTPFISGDESTIKTPTESKSAEESSSKPEQRANETYGEYRRRLAIHESEENRPKETFNKPRPPPQGPQRKPQINDFDPDSPFSPSPTQQNQQPKQNEKGNWMRNNNNSNNNNNNFNNKNDNNRKSRFEMNRSRDRNNRNNFNNNNNNNNNRRNNSRERNNNSFWENKDRGNSRDSRDDPVDMKDAFNYRIDTSSSGHDGGKIEKLNTLLNPKPVQFKGSFNKRTGFSNHNIRDRSRSRERTPANNSVEREFGEASFSSSDARPCYHTLKKIIEIDNEITKVHDKIHGIDKVISNLQSERIGYQKTFTKLQHDKKILFDNLVKRAMHNERNDRNNDSIISSDRHESREREKHTEVTIKKEKDRDRESTFKKVHEAPPEKRRKIEDSPVSISIPQVDDESTKKKKKYTLEEEPKSAAQRAKEKEEEERRKRIEEIRRQKQLRREREEAEKRKLEEQARKESNDTILILNRDKTKEREKEKKKEPQQATVQTPPKPHRSKEYSIKYADVIDPANVKIKKCKIQSKKMTFSASILQLYQSGKCPEIDLSELAQPSTSTSIKSEKDVSPIVAKKEKEVEEQQPNKMDPLMLPEKTPIADKDPLAIDETEEVTNPPTPGNNLPLAENDETDTAVNDQDYTEWTGNFESHDQPIVHIQNIDGKHMVCAAENGKLFKYHLVSGRCDGSFTEHTEICNSFLYDTKEDVIYTASSDGNVFRIKFKTFDSSGSKQFNEPLQVIEKSKHALFVGAKSGNIYKLKMDLSDDDLEPLCCVDSLILCMRWTKEGPRHILLISSRMNAIQVRDANEGLLLRTLSDELTGVSIYDMILEGRTIYCGSNLHEIFALDFTTGALIKKRSMSGAGAICVRIHKETLIVACYDGNIYIFDLNADDDAVNITGPSNMLLAMDLWNDKIIASTKDKTLKIMNIPT